MLSLVDGWTLEIRFNGEVLPINPDSLQRLALIESMNNLLPTMEFNFAPNAPVFQEFQPLTGGEVFRIDITKEVTDETYQREYMVTDHKANKENINDSLKPNVKITGVDSSGLELFKGSQRAIEGRPDEVVEEVVSPITSNVTADNAKGSQEQYWLQSGMTNAEFIKYLRDKAISTREDGPYYAFKRGDGSFVFRTLGGLYQEPRPSDHPDGRLVYASGLSEENEEGIDSPTRQRQSRDIVRFEVYYDKGGRYNGALGSQMMGWDQEEGEYTIEDSSIFDIDSHSTLTTLLLDGSDDRIRKVYTANKDSFNRGTTTSTESRLKQHILKENASRHYMDVYIRGYVSKLFAGRKVRVQINDASMESLQQDTISGDWLVHTKTEFIDKELYTKLRLMRDGINRPRAGGGDYAVNFSEPVAGKIR